MAVCGSSCAACLHLSTTTSSWVNKGLGDRTALEEASFLPLSSRSSFSSNCSRLVPCSFHTNQPSSVCGALEFCLRPRASVRGRCLQDLDLDRPHVIPAHRWRSSTVKCNAVQLGGDNEAELAAIKEAAREGIEGGGDWVDYDRENRTPVMPAGWEMKEREREANLRSVGIVIRRRPPLGSTTHMVGPFEFKIGENVPINILEEIVWSKGEEVDKMKEKFPLTTIRKGLGSLPPARDFIAELRARQEETGLPALIAEVKKASPSRGVLREDFDPVWIAKAYEKGGAACLSVLTDSKYFQGSFGNLQSIRDSGVQCPLLCKDFIVDAYQLFLARLKGADAVLLIAAVLPDQDLLYFSKIARSLGMAALVEVHTEQEMDRVLALDGIKLIGINNRDLGTFVVDIKNTENLLAGERGQKIKDGGYLIVGESGLFTPEDIAFVQDVGVGAVLVGESLVKQEDPGAAIAGLYGKDISKKSSS